MFRDKIWKKFPMKRGLFNGKTKVHWEREATKLVVESLLRASELDDRSVVGALASERLIELAKAESTEIYQEVLAERDACRSNFAKTMMSIFD